jgi:hypothetical protein
MTEIVQDSKIPSSFIPLLLINHHTDKYIPTLYFYRVNSAVFPSNGRVVSYDYCDMSPAEIKTLVFLAVLSGIVTAFLL